MCLDRLDIGDRPVDREPRVEEVHEDSLDIKAYKVCIVTVFVRHIMRDENYYIEKLHTV